MPKVSNPAPELTLVAVDGLLPGASNATLLARDSDGNPWVYKPDRGERPLWDFAHGSLSQREIACYRLSEALGLHVVPETLPADGAYGPGSAQRFLAEDFTWDPRPAILDADADLWPIAILDLVANNADRKLGHLLREPGREKIWAIDNGLTFHTDDKLRTVLWSFSGQPVPPTTLQLLGVEPVTKALEGLLATAEVDAASRRIERLLADPVHPGPPHDRPSMPWPVW